VSATIDIRNAFNSVNMDYMFQTWADDTAQAPPDSAVSRLRRLLPYLNYPYNSKQHLKMRFDGIHYKGQLQTDVARFKERA